MNTVITQKIVEFLRQREFISVASCDFKGKPNAAPKFLLKVEDGCIYLIDYSLSKTWENLKKNPQVSLSFMDTDTLRGYQINGPVEIIEQGKTYDVLLHQLREREVSLSAKRIIEGLRREKGHQTYEVAIPERFVIFKVTIKEVVEISPRGELTKENL